MEAIKRQLKYQFYDTKSSFLVFWIIVLLGIIAMYFVNFMRIGSIGVSNNQMVNVAGSNIISIVIYLIVSSMVMYYQCFPAAVGFSSSRRDFFIGAVLHNLLLSFIMAIIEGVLIKLDIYLVKFIGREPLYDLFIFNTKDDSIIYIILRLAVVFIAVSALFNLLGALLYRFTAKLWIVIGVAFVLIANSGVYNLFSINFKSEGLWLLLSVIVYFLCYLTIRRLAIRSTR